MLSRRTKVTVTLGAISRDRHKEPQQNGQKYNGYFVTAPNPDKRDFFQYPLEGCSFQYPLEGCSFQYPLEGCSFQYPLLGAEKRRK